MKKVLRGFVFGFAVVALGLTLFAMKPQVTRADAKGYSWDSFGGATCQTRTYLWGAIHSAFPDQSTCY